MLKKLQKAHQDTAKIQNKRSKQRNTTEEILTDDCNGIWSCSSWLNLQSGNQRKCSTTGLSVGCQALRLPPHQ